MKGKGSDVHSGRRGSAVIPCACALGRAQTEREEGEVQNKQKRRYLSVTLKQELLYSLEVCREIP